MGLKHGLRCSAILERLTEPSTLWDATFTYRTHSGRTCIMSTVTSFECEADNTPDASVAKLEWSDLDTAKRPLIKCHIVWRPPHCLSAAVTEVTRSWGRNKAKVHKSKPGAAFTKYRQTRSADLRSDFLVSTKGLELTCRLKTMSSQS